MKTILMAVAFMFFSTSTFARVLCFFDYNHILDCYTPGDEVVTDDVNGVKFHSYPKSFYVGSIYKTKDGFLKSFIKGEQ